MRLARYQIALAVVVAAAALAAAPVCAARKLHQRRVVRQVDCHERNTVEIIDSGSTNTAGYIMSISKGGEARYTLLSKRGSSQPSPTRSARLPAPLVARVFKDVAAAAPLDKHEAGKSCVKSTSFGTTLRVKFNGLLSPDISCTGVDDQLKSLYEDTREIIKVLDLEGKLGGL